MSEQTTGTLYLVATPIGNLSDLSARALATLREVGLIAAEDTRHTGNLLRAHGIQAELIAYREESRVRAAGRLLERLQAGADVALVSDAGTPGISDPGRDLVERVVAAGVRVVPIPGPCAAVCALSASGLLTDRFVFLGFPPRKEGALRRLAEELEAEPGTLILYESPLRLGRTLAILAEVLGPRQAVVARELTKIHETFDRSDLATLSERYQNGARGEVVLLVAGADPAASRRPASALGPLIRALRAGRTLGAGEVADLLSSACGADRREIYREAALIHPEET